MRISDWSSDVCSSDLIVAEHARRYGRDQTIYDPWHYVPVLAKKPGALRNGAPFKQLVLPPGLERLRSRLKESSDGDRRMVKILTAITVDGLDAVESAAAEALAGGVASADVRSEEHTTELQSLMRTSYAVFCLKKKKKNTRNMK